MRNKKFWAWFDDVAAPMLGARKDTFEATFKYLDKFDRAVTVIETGCAMDRHAGEKDNWMGDGRSTLLFAKYVQSNGGRVYTVDIDPVATRRCAEIVGHADQVFIATSDSVLRLRDLAQANVTADLVYLDSFDLLVTQPIPAALHHMNELTAAMPMIRPDTLVVVDDSPGIFQDGLTPRAEIGGKGMFVAKHADAVGADMLFHVYQVGWTNMTDKPGNIVGDEQVNVLVERARGHVERGSNINAETLYRIILGRTTPPMTPRARIAHGEACVFYARLALTKQKFGTASDWFREALAADPRAVEYRLELALHALRPMGNLQIAQQEAYKATLIEPENSEAYHILGGLEHALGNVDACIRAYDKRLELDPDDPDAMLDRVTIALDLSDYGFARKLLARVMTTTRSADAKHCLGMIAYREGRHEDAIVLYKEALAEKCNSPASCHWNMSLALHSIGRYREGWIEHEQRKFERNNPALALPMMRFTVPIWECEPPITQGPNGPRPTSVHVHAEAGMGDNICMARYMKTLIDDGYDVRYETHDSMIDLMRRSFPGATIMPKALDYPGAVGLKPFDYHLPIGSFPAVLETDIDTVPWPGPYLKHDPEKAAKYALELSSRRPNVGVCWSAGIRDGVWIAEYGRRKSMHFEQLRPILKNHPDIVFTSLQVGPERKQRNYPVSDLLPEKPTWDDTAALVACLDLVITVDTAIAHLAGAMGKPVWLMMHCEGSWHYMCPRPGAAWNERSPWYPSTRLYRQTKAYEWDAVLDRIAGDLRGLKASRVA